MVEIKQNGSVTTDRQKAIYAFQILNYFVGDLTTACHFRALYQISDIKKMALPEVLSGVNRLSLSSLFLTLAKWGEFYDLFLSVIPKDCREACRSLRNEVDRRGIKQFRNKFVGHIWDKKKGRPLTNPEIESFVATIVDGDQDAFCEWCNTPGGNVYPDTVVSIIERTRDRISEEFALTSDEQMSQ